MADEIIKIKVSQLPQVGNINNFEVLGVDKSTNQSARATMTQLRGLDGKQVTLRATSTHIQWRLGDGAWSDLISLSEITGPRGKAFVYSDFTQAQLEALKVKGDKGNTLELSVSATHIRWREAGTTAWVNLIDLEALKVKGDTGSNIELQKTTTHVQWRVVGGTWANLIPLSDLKGEQGDNISLQKTTTHIQWRLGTGTWTNLVALTELKGDTGANIELQKSATHVQWRVAGTATWNNLIPIDDLKVKGDTGANIELQKSTTHVQWRVVGSPTWINLIPLADLKGAKGDAPVKGVDYFDGKNPVLNIGTITTVASNAQADATVVADGVDVDGKPKFKLNLWLPKGVDGDGAGDMLKSVYDTQNRAVDVFDYIDNKTTEIGDVVGLATELTAINSKTVIKTAVDALDIVPGVYSGKILNDFVDEKVGKMAPYKWQYNEITDGLDLIKTV